MQKNFSVVRVNLLHRSSHQSDNINFHLTVKKTPNSIKHEGVIFHLEMLQFTSQVLIFLRCMKNMCVSFVANTSYRIACACLHQNCSDLAEKPLTVACHLFVNSQNHSPKHVSIGCGSQVFTSELC